MDEVNIKRKECLLSVIIITRNEEKYISKCIESVLKATRDIYDIEIVLADSASTDKTIEMAKKYPIKIIQLPSSYFSPAAGRYTGFLHSKGKYVFFIDGDMTLINGFLEKGMYILNKRDDLAGVGGMAYNCFNGSCEPMFSEIGEIGIFNGGGALFRRKTLDEVGCYNPNINGGGEEEELSMRIKDNGYKLLRIKPPMIYHWGKRSDANKYLKQVHYVTGIGQILRMSIKKSYFSTYVKSQKHIIFYMGWFIFNLLILLFLPIWIYKRFLLPIYICALIAGIVFILNLYKKKQIKIAFLSFIGFILMGFYGIVGFFRPYKKNILFLKNIKIIKQ